MTMTATTSFRERVQAAHAEAQQAREESETQAAVETLERVRTETNKLIADILGADTLTDSGLSINTQGEGSARFTVDGIPFLVRRQDSDYYSEWRLYVERPCTLAGCTERDLPALIQVLDLDDIGNALERNDARHEYGLHCTERAVQGTRTIIQIAANAYASQVTNEDGVVSSTLFALCDDGTLWQRDADRPIAPWKQIPPPSQIDEAKQP